MNRMPPKEYSLTNSVTTISEIIVKTTAQQYTQLVLLTTTD